MSTLHIEHPITDYETWRRAFDGFAPARAQGGVTAARISQPVDDKRYIVVDLDFATTAEASAFLSFLRDRVWAAPASAPALAGTPKARILEPAPENPEVWTKP